MAFEINDLKGILFIVLFVIPMITSTNINCSGRAFHCVNSTHFMICVDLGGGLSTTIDDFVIPCPATTVCHEKNVFECDFPEVTTPPLQIIAVYKQSDTSELTSVTKSAPTPSSEIFSVFKENNTATTLSIPEDLTKVVKLEVLENIKDPVRVNSDNTTEASFKVTSSFIYSTNEVVKDKHIRNNTITTSATDNSKHLEPVVKTSIHKPVNTFSKDKSKSIDTVTSVIGLIKLISTDLPSVMNTEPSSDVLTSLDTFYDNIATTTEQYITKQVKIHGETVEHVTEKIIIPTETIFNERFATTDKFSTTPVVNTYIESDKNNTNEFIYKIDSGNQTKAVGKSLDKSNNTSELVLETTTEYFAPIKIIKMSEPVTIDQNTHTTTDNTFVPLGLVDLIAADPKQNAPSTHDYINTTTTIDQYTTKLETTWSDKPVTVEVIHANTAPTINKIYLNVLGNDVNNDSHTELNSTVEITSKVPETDINYFTPEPITNTKKALVSITTEANSMYTPETNDLIKNDSLVGKHTTATYPLEIIITTDLPIEPTDNLYQIYREINQTPITPINNTASTITTTESGYNTTERVEKVFETSSTYMVKHQVTEPTLLPATTMKDTVIELTTASTLQNGFKVHAIEENDTLLYNTTNTMNATETVKTVFNASSKYINNGKSSESSTIKYSKIEISTTKTLHNEFTTHGIEVKNELPATIVPVSVNETNLENVGINALLGVPATQQVLLEHSYKFTSAQVTNTTVKDLAPQADIVTNPQTGVTPEIIAIKASDGLTLSDQATNQNVRTASETKIPGSPNKPENLVIVSLPENLNADQFTKTVVDEDVVGMTTTYWKKSSDVVKKSSLSDSVKSDNQDNIAADIASDIVTNPQTGFIPEIIALKASDGLTLSDQATNQNVRTAPETKIPGSPNQPENLVIVSFPENLNADQLNKTVVDEDVVGMTTTYWKNSSDVVNKTSLSDSVKSDNQDNIAAINIVKTQDVLPKTIPPFTELTSTTPKTVHTTSINVESAKIFEQVSTNTPELLNIYSVPTTDYKIETSIMYPVDVPHTINIENVTVMPVTTLPPQEATSQKNGTVKQLNTTSTTTKTVSDLVYSTVATAGYVVFNTSHLNTSSWKDSVNIDTVISKVDFNEYVKITDTVSPISGKNYVRASPPAINTNKDESSKNVSVSDIVNSSVITKPNWTLQPTSSNSLLSNHYVKITESQGLRAHVTATDVVPDYKYLVQTAELVTQKTPETIVFLAQTNVTNSMLSTTSTYTLPITEKKFGKVLYVGTETPLPSTVEFKHIINPTKTAVNYVTEKTNDYIISSTEAILTKLNKLPKVETESSLSSVTDLTPGTPSSPELLHSVPVYDGDTLRDSAFILSSTEVSPEVVTDNNIKISTESPLSTLQVMETQTVNYNTESSQPPPVAQMITEPSYTFNVFGQTTPLKNMNKGVLHGITTADSPQYVMSTLNSNIPKPMASLPTVGVAAAQITIKPTHSTYVFAKTSPLLATGRTNLNQTVLPEKEITDLPRNVLSTVNKKKTQSMPMLPIIEHTAAHMTTEPTYTTNVFAQTTPLLAASDKTNQDVLSRIKTTELPQYVTKTVTYNNTQWISLTRETITDSLTVPDSMVETIKVVGDKVSGTYLGNKSLSDVMSNNPTVDNANHSIKSLQNIFDHESIIVGTTTKYNEQNTPTSTAKSVDFNKSEIVNHTESNLMRSDSIYSVKIKESSIEEEDSIPSVLKSDTDVENKTLLSDYPIISKIEPKDGIPADKIVYRLTTVTTNYKEVESGAPNNVTQSKKIITKKNKNAEIDNTVNANIEIIDNKTFQVQVESKNISDGYNINNTKANITTLQNNLLQQKSPFNDELEQHLLSTNHTITAEIQSHLNESDTQSNKTSDEITVNGTSMHNQNITSIKLNADSNVTSTITVSSLVFNCSNHTRGKYADKKDCRKFYTCIGNLQPVLGTCPNNTVFSEIHKQCTRNLSHCVRNNQYRCLFEGRFSDFFKDNIYYICVKNRMNGFIRYKLQCQDDYHLNKDLVKCEKNEVISTQSASSVSGTNNDESKPMSEKNVKTDDFECENEGKFPYANDCSKYYVCNQIKNVYYVCVKNHVNGFIRYKLQCQDNYHLNKDSVKCEKNEEISTQSAASVSGTKNGESKPRPKSEKTVSIDDFECENEGKFPYAKDCNKYYVCTKIKNVYRRKIKKCASEEVFDKKKKKCVESDSREC